MPTPDRRTPQPRKPDQDAPKKGGAVARDTRLPEPPIPFAEDPDDS